MNSSQLLPVQFHGDTLFCLTYHDQPFTPMKPIVENLGLGWSSQRQKLDSNRDRWGVTMIVIPSDSGDQEMVCMPVRKLPAYMNSINPKKVRAELRAKIELYQNESDDALWKYWTDGQAVRQSAHHDTLTAAEQATILTPSTADDRKPLRSLVHAWAQIAGKSHTALWPQVKAHFQLARIDDLPVEWIPDALAFVQGKIDTTDRALPPATQPALPAATENTEFLPTMFPTFEKDILEIERLIERLCNGMSIFARPGSMMYSELVRNKQLIDAVQPCISAAKNAVGTGYFMMQTARKVYGAMR